MLYRFISKSSHLLLLTLVSSKTHFLNPNTFPPKSSFSIPKRNFFPRNSFFFSTGNNNSNGKDSDPLYTWKLSSETDKSVFNGDSASVEGTERRVFDGGFWSKELKGSCTDELTIKKSGLSKPSVSVYSEKTLEIIEILKGGGEDLTRRLSLVAPKLSFKLIIEIFERVNEHRISGLKFFNWLRDSYPEFYRSAYVNSLIICNCGWLDDYKTMLSLLVEFKAEEICLTDKAFGFLTLCGSSKDSLMNSTRKVVDMLNEVGGSCRGSGVYGLIEMFCCLDLFDMATFVIEITERTASHYNILIRKRCKAGHIEEARAIINEMFEYGCSPNTNSYNYLLGTLCKNDKMEDVSIVLEEMRNKGLNLDAITYETLVYHSSSRGRVDIASEFLKLMVNENVEPRSTTHAAYLKVFLEAGEREKAYKYVIDMSAKYNHCVNVLYSLLVRLHQKKGDLMAAQNILNEMIDKGLKPDFGVFIEIVKQLQKTGRKSISRDLKTKYSVFYCSDIQKASDSSSNSSVPCQG
ncbi:PREDICTED: pentatricopeptide repeat-containing protein At3g60050-like [Nicotiana attenuata]|uniref:pentatricopeptide repeat-containing protein At3g60050-like n=1 Tax=Nicotiana attenuata TaxID=49451 RepID=UPI0009057B4E|nr:PREDICTED: pentatricopeptide repeat-containing protein At3g60050-like [Nicotiana attenuata]XP_019243334.1 PREDICTED: pentatricopeptide repeat-containing protein At3g60050-like [Nicotiana attenuata]XP_019243335.1 PREDICTED: pentatricopeptide repeat-containing protein At3g60050-like [Nicotiana attenuata]XP_019243336.1 PREDICTED: pentatricopeptide repeat-containing protein At3g60050-like [Nicotiana attenuata]XP_019243337.1 PREDICTED: pentatricopeptide repeat-containing protein At3g60050-like [N